LDESLNSEPLPGASLSRFLITRKTQERILVLGTGLSARGIATTLKASRIPCCIVGFVSESDGTTLASATRILPGPVLGAMSEMRAIVESVRPSRVIVALGKRDHIPLRHLLHCVDRGIIVEGALQAYERLNGKLALEQMTPGDLLCSDLFGGSVRRRPLQETIARAISMTLAAVGLVVTAPLIVLIAALIKIDSPGPALFVQKRIGLHGRRFSLVKFRTMVDDKRSKSQWAQDNTHRITRVGKWVRKFWLDELLQFVNIIRGDMNLVGPRPQPASNRKLFSTNIPYYALRATVRPGLTGWAQVRNGYANNLEQEIEKMRYDMYYIKNRTLWLDLRIILETLKVVFVGVKPRVPTSESRRELVDGLNEPRQFEPDAPEQQGLSLGFAGDETATDVSSHL
jgi:exopolysaccharide biosynthesis polyprenyl glycosylphosphotransferase